MGSATWLINEMDPVTPDLLAGLCDLGMGTPEYGSLSRADLENFRNNQAGLGLERDLHFHPAGAMSAYADAASKAGYIVDPL